MAVAPDNRRALEEFAAANPEIYDSEVLDEVIDYVDKFADASRNPDLRTDPLVVTEAFKAVMHERGGLPTPDDRREQAAASDEQERHDQFWREIRSTGIVFDEDRPDDWIPPEEFENSAGWEVDEGPAMATREQRVDQLVNDRGGDPEAYGDRFRAELVLNAGDPFSGGGPLLAPADPPSAPDDDEPELEEGA